MKIIDEKAWGEPLVGFSNGADELFIQIKRDIGEFYWGPIDIYNLTFTDSGINAKDLTVISWILPQTEQTKQMQRKENDFPSRRWVFSREFGEVLIVKVAEHVVNLLTDARKTREERRI